MNERYSKLFALPENLYSAGAPVIIVAGALQKDHQTGKVFVQLKIRNIQDKTIKAATVKIVPFDTVGKTLSGAIDYQYLDLSVERDAYFGPKIPVILSDTATRAFSVSVMEVIYSDNSTWTAISEEWESLSVPVTLEKALADGELAKQYRIRYGADCKYFFKKEKDLWRCTCGALNHAGEENCHICQREANVIAALNMDELKADRDIRLAAEKKAAVERAKKMKKLAMIAAPIAVIVVIITAVFVKVQDSYDAAVALVEAEEYDEAIDVFTELGYYRDSKKQVKNIKDYLNAIELMKEKDYEAAAEIFTVLDSLGDSAKQLALIKKLKACGPYIGEFIYVLKGEEQHLSSDFDIRDGKVIWAVTMPEGELMGIRSGYGYSTTFFLSDGNTRYWPVSEDMTVIDDQMSKGTVTVKFKNGNIMVDGSGIGSDNFSFWNRCYEKAE